MSGTAAQCHMPWCVPFLPATAIYSFIGTLLSLDFSNTFLLYRWIHPSAVLVCFGVYPLVAILLCRLLREFSHIGTKSSCISYASGLLCSQYPLFFFFSSLASAVKRWL